MPKPPPDLFARPHAAHKKQLERRMGGRPTRPGQLPATGTPGRMFSHISDERKRGRKGLNPLVFVGACVVLAVGVVAIEAAIAESRRVDAVRVVFMEEEAAEAAAQVVRDGGLAPLPAEEAPPAPPPD